jgi:uncharacterized membrane protein YfcA
MHELAFVVAGFLVGAIVGLTGVGGGSLMTPILIFVFGIKPYLAVGTDLLFAAFTKMGGTVKLARSGRIDWAVVRNLSAGSIPASLITLYILHTVGPADPKVQAVMTSTLGCALLLTAAATLYKAVRGKTSPVSVAVGQERLAATPQHWLLPLLFGALIGTLVTLTSVGAGAIGVTVLMILYPLLPLQRIIAADIAYAVPLTLVAGLGHATLGTVDWTMLISLLAGSLPGIWIGSHLTTKAPERLIRSLLSLLLAYAGLKLIAL